MDRFAEKLAEYLFTNSDEMKPSTGNLINMLDMLDIGLFFLNPNGIVLEEPSTCFQNFFKENIIHDISFLELLNGRVPEKTIHDTSEYLNLMFDDEHDEKTLNELNPLKEVEVYSKNDHGLWSDPRHLSFTFKRFKNSHGEQSLIGLVRDGSSVVELLKKLEDVEKKNHRQIQWLISLLHIDLPLLNEFVSVIEYELARIDLIIKSTQTGTEFSTIIPKLVRSIYHINSSAVIMNLDFFTKESFRFKDEIEAIKNKPDVNGHDFVPIVMGLGNMHRMLSEIKELMKHIKGLDNSLRTTRRFDGGLIIRLVENLINHLTELSGKKIILKYHNFDYMGIPFKYRQIIKEFIIALTRFVIEFGIESADKRKSLNVNPAATIEIASELNKNVFTLHFRHDGNLIQIERILQQSLDEHQKALYDNNKIENCMHPGSEVMRLFLNPDISMLDNKGTSEGKQIMNDFELVKKKLKMHGGRIKVVFTSESFCEYTVTIPFPAKTKNTISHS